MTRLMVYELDQAATQETKRRRMRKAEIPTPERLRYVAAGLNSETLHGALDRAGFDATRPTLFSWFGVTYYLGKDAIRQTLQSIAAKMAPGSTVMFDYLADPASTPAASRGLRERCADFVARRGEPWIFSFDPAGIPDFLAGIGYSEIGNLKPDRIGPRYFSGHPDLVYPPSSACATRPPQRTDIGRPSFSSMRPLSLLRGRMLATAPAAARAATSRRSPLASTITPAAQRRSKCNGLHAVRNVAFPMMRRQDDAAAPHSRSTASSSMEGQTDASALSGRFKVACTETGNIRWRLNASALDQVLERRVERRDRGRTVNDLWEDIAQSIEAFNPEECQNFFAATGYDQD